MAIAVSSVCAATRPSIRPARIEDYSAIASVEASNGLTPKRRDEWIHLWSDNPAFQQLPEWPIGWVLEDREEGIVGTIGNIPFTYHLDGKTHLTAVARGWSVVPRFRSYSIWLLLEHVRQSNVDLQLTTTPSATAAAVYTRLGWAPPPVGRWDRASLWVASYAGVTRHYLSGKVRGVLSSPVRQQVERRSRTSSSCGLLPLRTGVELDWCDRFDQPFQVFWDELRERNPQLLLAGRSQVELAWHYKFALAAKRVWVLRAWNGRQMLAYAIFQKRNLSALNLSLLGLMDFQTLHTTPDLCQAMLSFALSRCREEGIDVLENTGCWIEGGGLLNRPAPLHRSLKCVSYLYSASNAKLRATLGNADKWHPTQYDGDAGL